MDLGTEGSRLTGEGPATIVWRSTGAVPELRCSVEVLADIAELAVNGYRRYSWGGVEIGGVLFGRQEAGIVYISHFRVAQCEHRYGPSFDFSDEDSEAFEQLLASAVNDEELSRVTPVGWYHTVSRDDLGPSEHARALFRRFFPHSWQVTMVVKRSKQAPLSIGIFVRDSRGRVELHSPAQEFTLDSLQQSKSRAAVPEMPERKSDRADPLAEHLAETTPPSAPSAPSEQDPVRRTERVDEKASSAATLQVPDGLEGQATPAQPSEPPLTSEPLTADTHSAVASLIPDLPFLFFGLTAEPFCSHPDAQFFYPSHQHREALAILFHRIRSHSGFLVLSGEPGTGKSIVLECLKDLLKSHATQFAVLLNSKINVAEFFELLAHDFRLPCANPTKTATLIALNEYLLERSRTGQTTALVVDSAEKLSTDVLEEIELLGNLENRAGRLLQVVFAAQPSFEERMDAPELRGLKQRLWRARLEPLTATETAAYIEHRMVKASMSKAGACIPTVFPPDVVAEIHRRTRGVPRQINTLCSRLLMRCRELEVKMADLGMLEGIADGLPRDSSL